MKPYTPPETGDKLWHLVAITIAGFFGTVMFLILFGCSSPLEPKEPDTMVIDSGLVPIRPCSYCHEIQNGIILDGRIK